jgi:hypothetical protein
VLFKVSPDKLVRGTRLFLVGLSRAGKTGRLKIVFTTRQTFAQEIRQADSLLLAKQTHPPTSNPLSKQRSKEDQFL